MNFEIRFLVYKLPKIRHRTGTLFGDGLEFFYMDSNHPKWLLSPVPINESDQAIAYTLNQIYQDKSSEVNYFMYNDEKPSGSVSLNHGHTKGTLGFDTQSGFWLIHSAPGFPPEKGEGYQWAENASDFGQSFLCVTFLYSTLGVLGKQLVINYPQVYDKYLSKDVMSDYQILSDVGTRPSEQFPVSNVEHFSTKDGVPLTSFAKFTTFGAEQIFTLASSPYSQGTTSGGDMEKRATT
ncbi:hypothetical protein C0Q70_17904 [Pomacea canaliculata]|uniref:Uncharacterized protein n=1 Tax=Pomacea canaliculata TaxID=400727 RepID=A0A2T7NLR1_POMCA|nr:hypothetical protein C0Q70_17904 [Pomacea canaliculata]